MTGVSDRRSAEFFDWARLGGGRPTWPRPVALEPPFSVPERRPVDAPDDGRRPTAISSLLRRVSARLAPASQAPRKEEPPRPEAQPLDRGGIVEVRAHVPQSARLDREACEGFFSAISTAAEPVSFEIVADGERVAVQFASSERDEAALRAQLSAFFPDVAVSDATGHLASRWGSPDEEAARVAVGFALGREFVVPLSTRGRDPYVGLVGAMSTLGRGEAAVFQVLFSPVSPRWNDAIVRSVSHADGSALFVNAPELLGAAKEKAATALFAAVVRVGARADTLGRCWEIACGIGAALGAYGSVRGNELVPLSNDDYAEGEHEAELLGRQSRRSGMILNAQELAALVHIPSGDVRSERLRRRDGRTKAAPAAVAAPGLRLGTNEHLGQSTPVRLSRDARSRHLHVIGASGTGKSTLLYNLIRQDIESGEGVSVLDPHGDLVDRLLGCVPAHRAGDVVLVDPADQESVVPFNILSAQSDWERSLLASDLVSVFRRQSTSWGDQLNSVLHNALLAFLESDRDGTLHDVRRFLVEPVYRSEFLKTVRDPGVAYYWRKAFPLLTGNRSVGPIITRLDAFLSQKAIRHMVAHGENRIDFRAIMDGGKIFLAKLSRGAIGRENSHLLGSLFVAKIQAEAMSRQRQDESSRRYHFLYADEFHEFLTPSLGECLSGVRKYRLGLVLAHQELRQVERDPDVASSLMNAYARVVFRVSDRDARALESGFSSFAAADLQNLSVGEAVCRVERADWDFNLRVDPPEAEDGAEAQGRRRAAVEASRRANAIPRRAVEESLRSAAEEAPRVAVEVVREERPSAPPPLKPAAAASEPPIDVIPEEPKPLALPAPPAAQLGKGGAQHRAIQERIKAEAEALGFKVIVEKEVLGGLGQVDVSLTRGGLSVACEVSVENTVDYEVGNVSKCIKAGYAAVAVVSTTEEKLAKLRAAVANSLGPDAAKLTTYHLPDAFFAWLRAFEPAKQKAEEPVRTRGGRVVKRKSTAVSPEEAKQREAQALEIMAKMMKKAQGQ